LKERKIIIFPDPEERRHVCAICGARWEDGKGFVDEHKPLCANERYGWAFTIEIDKDGNPLGLGI
jgi:hypothetical protein